MIVMYVCMYIQYSTYLYICICGHGYIVKSVVKR